jgi:hypothetical protein
VLIFYRAPQSPSGRIKRTPGNLPRGCPAPSVCQTGPVPETPADPAPRDAELICSARGCRRSAAWALLWNNPKLHPPERRKTWLACDDHRTPLEEFLALRAFLRETTPVTELS